MASGTRSLARRSLGSSGVLARGSVELSVLGERDSELTCAGEDLPIVTLASDETDLGGEVANGELNSCHLVDDVGTVLTDGVLSNSRELIAITDRDAIFTWEGMRDKYPILKT